MRESESEGVGWRRLWQIGVTPGLAGAWTLAGLVLFGSTVIGLARLEAALHPDWRNASPLLALISVLLAVPLTLVAHEGVHGVVFRAFGGRPRYGAGLAAGLPYFYAACPGRRFSRDRFLLVGLAPLVVLDLAGLALMLGAATAFLGAGLVAFNTTGAIGDLWAVGVLLQAPRWIHVEDVGATFIAWAPPERAAEAAGMRPPRGLDARVPFGRWVVPWFVTMLAVFVIGAGPLGAAARSQGEVRLGPLVLATRHQLNVGAGLLLAAVLSALLMLAPAAYAGVRGRARRRAERRNGPRSRPPG